MWEGFLEYWEPWKGRLNLVREVRKAFLGRRSLNGSLKGWAGILRWKGPLAKCNLVECIGFKGKTQWPEKISEGQWRTRRAGEVGRSLSFPGYIHCVKSFPLYSQKNEKPLKGFDQKYDMIRFAFWKDAHSGYRQRMDYSRRKWIRGYSLGGCF